MNRFARRAARARQLAVIHAPAAVSLEFFAQVSELQARGAGREEYRSLAAGAAPEEWLDRIEEELDPAAQEGGRGNECPRCASPPQLGILRAQGDGHALYLACALCRHEWVFSRKHCPQCSSENISFATAGALPGYQTLTCEGCRIYLHLLDETKLPGCVPEADEIAAQPLDIWAIENGYHKLTANLAGI